MTRVTKDPFCIGYVAMLWVCGNIHIMACKVQDFGKLLFILRALFQAKPTIDDLLLLGTIHFSYFQGSLELNANIITVRSLPANS